MASLITSVQNPRVKQIVALRDKRTREALGQMVVEGYDELSLAFRAGTPITLLYCPAIIRQQAQWSLIETAKAKGVELVEVNERVFEKMAYRENPDGWLAVFSLQHHPLDSLVLGQSPLIVVAEGIEKPGNLGAILRTADAAGVTAVIAADSVTDLGNPNVVRASKGTVFCVPVAEATTAATIVWCRTHGLTSIAATPQATRNYTDVDMRGPIAIIVGGEKPGLSAEWLNGADIAVRIPMVGAVNSLNVATATALLVYEAVKQRSRNALESLRT